MPYVSEVMSTDVRAVEPQESLRRAARLMSELDVGVLPVCSGDRLLGMLTDRDITVRGVANGLKPDEACVSDVMSGVTSDVKSGAASRELACCSPDQDTDAAMRLMGQHQVRRLPVVDADRKLVGIVSLGDLALRQRGHLDQTVRDISGPGAALPAAGRAGTEPRTPGTRAGADS